jgi:hypothetical protein
MAEKRKPMVVNTKKQVETAPTANKAKYLKLPSKIQRFKPVAGQDYTVIFLPWIAGKGHPEKGEPVATRFIMVHAALGPNSEAHYCLAHINKPCPVCEMFQEQRLKCPRGDKTFWRDQVMPFSARNRELMLIHVLKHQDPKNLFIWDEAVGNFGDSFRAMFQRREAWRKYANLEDGCTVEFSAAESTGGDFKFVTCKNAIVIEPRTEPLDKWLVEAAYNTCVDDFLVYTPYAELARLLGQTGGDDSNGEDQERMETPSSRVKERTEEDELAEEEDEEEEDDEEQKVPEKPTRKPTRSVRPAVEDVEEAEPDDDEDDDDEEVDPDDEEPEPDPEPVKPKTGKKKPR